MSAVADRVERRDALILVVIISTASTLTLAIPAQRPTTPLTRHTLELLQRFVPRALRAGGQASLRAT